MSDQDPQLPEDLRKALKGSPTFTPPESFYTGVLRKIRVEDARVHTPRPSRWAWMWGPPARLAAATGIILISYFAIRDKTSWGPKKADMVYDQVSSASRAPAMAQAPAPVMAINKRKVQLMNKSIMKKALGARKDLPALHVQLEDRLGAKESDVIATPIAAERAALPYNAVGGLVSRRTAPLPWQSNLQAQQYPAAAAAEPASTSKPAAMMGMAYEGKSLDDASRDESSGSWSGTDSAIFFFRTAVITTAADWAVLWRAHAKTPAPVVDFDQWMIVGVFAGTRPDIAAVAITDIQTLPDQILVHYRDVPFPELAMASPGAPPRRPYTLRAIAKTSLPVRFKKIP